jgi:tricorn protease-like protein
MIFNCSSYKTRESWLKDPPYNFKGEKIKPILIPNKYEDEYFEKLSKNAYCIFPHEISELKNKKTHTIAVRAVYTNLGGEYEVLQNDNGDISINYMVLGKVKKINKSILLLQVDILPVNVFISYTGAR